jgi:hypothetical protein
MASVIIPLELKVAALPVLEPGGECIISFHFQEKQSFQIRVDMMRPTGFSPATEIWRP